MVKNTLSLFIYILVTLLYLINPTNLLASPESNFEAKVTKVLEEENSYQKLELVGQKGDYKGKTVIIENGLYESSSNVKYSVGDRVMVTEIILEGQDSFYTITDQIRHPALLYLSLIFVALVVLITGKWGILSILGMAYSFYVIFVFVLPMILKGYDAVLISVIGSAFIIPVTFSFSHGLNRKTANAMLGTFISMVVVGLLSFLFVNLSKLTGFAAEESSFLQYQLGELINLKGILLAGIIISSLGVMDDITVSQASVVEELRDANKKLSKWQLFTRSMKVGKDHIASMVNTLVLVYTGASLPLLLLFVNTPHPFLEIINYEIIAEEIVRTLVGSIGLVLAVPITSYIASFLTINNVKKT